MIPEAVLLDALQAVHTGRLRVHEAYRTIRAAETTGVEQWCVQYRCPPGMTEWQEWQGSLRHAEKWARLELAARLEEEFDPSVEYRVAHRTTTDWQAAL